MQKIFRLLAPLLCSICLLSACGQSGKLYLPDRSPSSTVNANT